MGDDTDEYYKRNNEPSWPGEALKRHLTMNFPGCQTAVDAVKSLLKNKTQEQNQTALQMPKLNLGEKFTEVSTYIENQLSGVDENQITQETRDKLANMPLNSIDEIRAWGMAWIAEIKKIRK